MSEDIVFKGRGYLEKSYLDKEGAKHITFELSAKDAVEIAKLELMGRDLVKHQPVLLDITVKISSEKGSDARSTRKTQTIR